MADRHVNKLVEHLMKTKEVYYIRPISARAHEQASESQLFIELLEEPEKTGIYPTLGKMMFLAQYPQKSYGRTCRGTSHNGPTPISYLNLT